MDDFNEKEQAESLLFLVDMFYSLERVPNIRIFEIMRIIYLAIALTMVTISLSAAETDKPDSLLECPGCQVRKKLIEVLICGHKFCEDCTGEYLLTYSGLPCLICSAEARKPSLAIPWTSSIRIPQYCFSPIRNKPGEVVIQVPDPLTDLSIFSPKDDRWWHSHVHHVFNPKSSGWDPPSFCKGGSQSGERNNLVCCLTANYNNGIKEIRILNFINSTSGERKESPIMLIKISKKETLEILSNKLQDIKIDLKEANQADGQVIKLPYGDYRWIRIVAAIHEIQPIPEHYLMRLSDSLNVDVTSPLIYDID